MRIYIVPGIIVVLALLLQACGNKGPLTLPPAQSKSPQTQSPNSPDPQPSK